ncbi:MAG: Kazal-type serine protease inhibitor, partial [bacterium]|nr:Kazal-type serine protease inhibitor [bacterium]
GFGGGDGGLGGLGGGALGQLLPLLMQGLMGGGQGQQGQGKYGAGYGNQQQSCAAQAVAPVCGMDGKTYNNSCYLNQQGVILRNTGVCVAPSTDSGQATPNINSIVTLTQLSQSGIPATLLENVRNLVTTVLSSIIAGSAVQETTVN